MDSIARLRVGVLIYVLPTRRCVRPDQQTKALDQSITASQLGLDLLVELDCLAASAPAIGGRGGRPKVTYEFNPRTLA
jgi:hypothetical protein